MRSGGEGPGARPAGAVPLTLRGRRGALRRAWRLQQEVTDTHPGSPRQSSLAFQSSRGAGSEASFLLVLPSGRVGQRCAWSCERGFAGFLREYFLLESLKLLLDKNPPWESAPPPDPGRNEQWLCFRGGWRFLLFTPSPVPRFPVFQWHVSERFGLGWASPVSRRRCCIASWEVPPRPPAPRGTIPTALGLQAA